MIQAITSEAAAILDEIASGKLTQGEFYVAMERAGMVASDLALLVLRGLVSGEDQKTIMRAAEALKEICIGSNLEKMSTALATARMHVDALYSISEKRSAA